MRPSRWLLVPGVVGGVALGAFAHVRLHNPSNSNPLFWQTPGALEIVIQSDGSDDLLDQSHETAIRNAIAEWNSIAETTLNLVEDESDVSQARTDWGADDIHLVMFDEDNSSGFFPNGSGTVALTPVWFFSSGRISDADILFNGKGFHFTTSGDSGRFDVQDVAAHELGHLVGLDHSGWSGGTMYPFVDPTVILHRSLSLDEVTGIRAVYPGGAHGILRGRILRAVDETPVAGAHVVARDEDGYTAGGTLADASGNFQLSGLSAGTYSVYAVPLDEPVSAANLTVGHVVDVDFESTVYPGTTTLTAGGTVDLGNLHVGDDVTLNLGRSYDRYPRRVIAGLTSWIIIRGTGLEPGSVLEASDPSITVLPLDWVNFQVNFQVVVPEDAKAGHVDLKVTNTSGDVSILPAALEVTPPSPTVSAVTPALGSVSGGTTVQVDGTNFLPGCRVVIGDQIYVEGTPECTLVDPTRLEVQTRATIEGVHDVVVIDDSGVEGRMGTSYQTAALPGITSIFPAAGAELGGTALRIRGVDFLPGVVVRIDGVVQPQVTIVDATTLDVITEPAASSGPLAIEVSNPGGYTASLPAAFAYVAAVDPHIDVVEPTGGASSGGDEVSISGSGFTADTRVYFGADPETGTGGMEAAVTFVDATTLMAVTPSHPPGDVSVLARLDGTGQTTVVAAGFTFNAASGGGGGCTAWTAGSGASGERPSVGGAWWLFGLAGLLVLRRRRVTRPVLS